MPNTAFLGACRGVGVYLLFNGILGDKSANGAIMAATALNSPEAVAMSVFVVRAFMQMREQLAANAAILKRLSEIDKTLLEHDSALRSIWTRLQPLLAAPAAPPRRIRGFNPKDE